MPAAACLQYQGTDMGPPLQHQGAVGMGELSYAMSAGAADWPRAPPRIQFDCPPFLGNLGGGGPWQSPPAPHISEQGPLWNGPLGTQAEVLEPPSLLALQQDSWEQLMGEECRAQWSRGMAPPVKAAAAPGENGLHLSGRSIPYMPQARTPILRWHFSHVSLTDVASCTSHALRGPCDRNVTTPSASCLAPPVQCRDWS